MATDFKGTSRDTSRMKTPQQMWEYARNILLAKGYLSVVNEDGFDFKHTIPGTLVGVIATNDAVVFLSVQDEYSCIGTVNTNIKDDEYKLVLRTNNPDFRFNIGCPIEGIYTYNYKKELIIVITDGVKNNSSNPKLFNVTKPQVELDASKELVNPNQVGLLRLFPDSKEGIIELDYNDEGILDVDVVYVTYSYVYADNTDTVYFPITNLAYTSTGIEPLNRRSLNINITDLDENFSKLRLGLLVVKEGGLFGYQSNIFSYEGTTFNTTINSLTNLGTINPDELVLTKTTFDKIETITRQNNQVLVGNTVKEEINQFQKYANQLELELYIIKNDEVDDYDIHNHPSFMPDEAYAFYIDLQGLDSTYSRAFHLPGRTAQGTERTILNNSYFNAVGLDPLKNQGYREFHFINRGDYLNFNAGDNQLKWGYWENEETYPNEDEYNSTVDYEGNPLGGSDLRGKPIRYHRFPALDTLAKYRLNDMPNGQTIKDDVPRFGIRIANFDAVVPQEIKDKIQGYRLSFIKRNRGDSLVETNTVLLRNTLYPNQFDGVDYDNESVFFKQRGVAEVRQYMLTSGAYDKDFGRAKAYNNDLYKFKPRIDPTIVKANYMFFMDEDELENEYYNLLVSEDRKMAIFEDIDYLEGNNVAAKTRFTEDSIVMEFKNYLNPEDTTWRPTQLEITNSPTPPSWDTSLKVTGYTYNPVTNTTTEVEVTGTNDPLRFGLNATLLNIQKNIYTGFKSTNLVTVGRTNLNNIDRLFKRAGDVFTNNRISMTIQQNLQCNIRRQLLFNGLYSVTNNTELYTDEAPKDAGDSDGVLCPNSTSDLNELNGLDYTVEVKGEEVLSTINDITALLTFDVNDPFIDYFPYRINRGLKIPNESLNTRALRSFLSDDYMEMRNDRGVIVALRGSHKQVFIQQQFSLFVASVKDKLETGTGESTYLGESDLFDRTPEEILYNENKGYIGCSSKFACIITKDGYITVDQIQGKIFIIGDGVQEISRRNMRNWFKDNWDIGTNYLEEDRLGNKIRVDNPYVSVGHIVGYDDDYDRLIFTKKMYRFKLEEEVGTNYTFDGQFYYDNEGKVLDFNNEDYFENLCHTWSYSLSEQTWICPHDYYPNLMYYTNIGMYSILTDLSEGFTRGAAAVYKHNSKDKSKKGLFYGKRYESYVDLIFNSRLDLSKMYQAVYWSTEVTDESGARQLYETINKILLYNNNQSSGIVELDGQQFKSLRRVEDKWQFNDFRDLVINPNLPIIKEQGEVNEDNININKVWYEKSNIIGNFIVVRLIMSNVKPLEINIHTVNVKSRISKR